jgi:hypothetical protein
MPFYLFFFIREEMAWLMRILPGMGMEIASFFTISSNRQSDKSLLDLKKITFLMGFLVKQISRFTVRRKDEKNCTVELLEFPIFDERFQQISNQSFRKFN